MKFLVYCPTCACVLSLKQIILILFNLKSHSKEMETSSLNSIFMLKKKNRKKKKRKMETKLNNFF